MGTQLKYILICLCFFSLSPASPLYAQTHLKGLKAMEVSVGTVGMGGYFGSAGYSKYLSSRSYIKAAFSIDARSYRLIEDRAATSRYLLSGSYQHCLWKDRKGNVYLNAQGGGFAGYEDVNFGQRILGSGRELSAESRFVYGILGGLEAEYFIKDHFSLLAQLQPRWLINSSVKDLRFYSGVGIKWIISN